MILFAMKGGKSAMESKRHFLLRNLQSNWAQCSEKLDPDFSFQHFLMASFRHFPTLLLPAIASVSCSKQLPMHSVRLLINFSYLNFDRQCSFQGLGDTVTSVARALCQYSVTDLFCSDTTNVLNHWQSKYYWLNSQFIKLLYFQTVEYTLAF